MTRIPCRNCYGTGYQYVPEQPSGRYLVRTLHPGCGGRGWLYRR